MGYLTDPPTDEQIDRLIRERYSPPWRPLRRNPARLVGQMLARALAREADDYDRRHRAENR